MSKQTINFTQQTLNKLPPAEPGKRAYFYDTRQAGLQIAVTDRGSKSFYLYRKIKGKPTRILLGPCPGMSIEQARKAAHKVLGKLADNIDVVAEKRAERAKSVPLQTVFDEYLKTRKGLKPKTIYLYERIMAVAFADWLDKPLLSITKDKISERHTKLGTERGQHYANGAMRVLRALFNFAGAQYENTQGRSLVPENPVKRLSQTRAWYPIKRRDSVVKPYQLPDWFRAVLELKGQDGAGNPGTVADFLLVLIFTGLRLNEAAKLAWDQVDLKAKTLSIEDTKNREKHTLPLSDYLYELFEARHARANGSYVFPGEGPAGHLIEPRRQTRKVIEVSGVQFMIHDLRRTFLTVAESLDIPAYALKRLVNHKMTNDVTAGYIITDIERLRKPMQMITDFLLSAGEVKPKAKIRPIRARGKE